MSDAAPLVPDYGVSTLAELLPSIGGALGVPGRDATLDLPPGDRWVLLMVDGLGAANLDESQRLAPFLAEAWGEGGRATLTSGAPSTTATSITSLGTGLTPGQHGMVGYSFRSPQDGGLLNALVWREGHSALDLQPQLTMFERLASAGVLASSVSPARFEGSGLTLAALRGARFVPVPDEHDVEARVGWAADAAASADRTVTYIYERFLDHAGHGHGWRSPEWAAMLAHVDTLARRLRAALPPDTRLVITGDHGMVDVPRAHWVVAEEEPGLLDDVTLIAGEGRFRHFYTPRPDAVAARWADRLGEDAWVLTREQAVAAGWFGPFLARGVADRIGDVLVVTRGDLAVMTTTQPREFGLLGMHGALTEAEMRVPLVVC